MYTASRSGNELLIDGGVDVYPYDQTQATLTNGSVAVAYFEQNDDQSLNAVKVQVVDAQGQPVGDEITVRGLDSTTTSLSYPQVTALTDGGFAVSYLADVYNSVTEITKREAHVRLFDAEGQPSGPEQVVYSPDGNDSLAARVSIAGLTSGGFVAVVEAIPYSNDDSPEPASTGLIAQRYDADGNPVGSLLTPGLDDTTGQEGFPDANRYPQVAALDDGGFAVFWAHNDINTPPDIAYRVDGQTYDAQGNPIGPLLSIGVSSYNAPQQIDVTGLSNGSYVVTWTDGPTDTSHLHAQVFSATGSAITTEFVVDSIPSNAPIQPVVSALPDGGFAIAWADFDFTGYQGYSIHGRSFNATGLATSPEFIANATAGPQNWMPGISTLADGNLFITWQGAGAGSSGLIGQIIALSPGDGLVPIAGDDQGYVSRGTIDISQATLLRNDTGPSGPLFINDGGAAVGGSYLGLDQTTEAILIDTTNESAATASFSYTLTDGTMIDVGQVNLNVIQTTSSNDTLTVPTGANAFSVIDALAGNDNVTGGAGFDTLRGNEGDDKLYGLAGADLLDGGAGNDVLTGGLGNDTIDGGAGADQLVGSAGNDELTGGTGDDRFYVDNLGDTVHENAGEGTDNLYASVSYTLTAGASIEYLRASGSGSFALTGNDQNNNVVGGAGADTLAGGAAGTDKLYGGAGNDTYLIARTSGVTIVENANEGTDTVQASVGTTLGANLENLTLTGTSAINGTGNTLANVLTGNGATNTLQGMDGNDTLVGGGGADRLYGNAGSDTFTFKALSDSALTARDGIYDFVEGGTDKIDLSAIDAITGGADNAFTLVSAYTGVAGQLRTFSNTTTTYVEGDVNGDRKADFQILLTGVHTLQAGDFVL